MVLEEAIPSADTDTLRDDSMPPSDSDPYSSSTFTYSLPEIQDADMGQLFPRVFPGGYRIPIKQLPHAIPLLGPLFGFNLPDQFRMIVRFSTSLSENIRRPITVEESNAIAWHTSKAYAISSYGYPLGAGGSFIRWWGTQKTMRFPFYQPDLEKYKFQSFGPLKGRVAYNFWQSLRLTSYTLLGGWVGKMFLATYGATVMLTGQRLDNRLQKAYEEVIKSRNIRVGQDGATPNAAQGPERQQEYGREGSMLRDNFRDQSSNEAQFSSSSPTDSMDDQRSYESSPASTYQEGQDTSRPARSDFDDASPTAGNEQLNSGSNYNSAWDRLRKGGPSSPQSPQSKTSASRRPEAGGGGDDAWARVRGPTGTGQEQQSGSTGDENVSAEDKKWR